MTTSCVSFYSAKTRVRTSTTGGQEKLKFWLLHFFPQEQTHNEILNPVEEVKLSQQLISSEQMCTEYATHRNSIWKKFFNSVTYNTVST